jgi:hypothetical protein
MRIRIVREVRFTPPEERRIGFHFKTDTEATIKRSWGTLLVALGYAVEIAPPNRPERPE